MTVPARPCPDWKHQSLVERVLFDVGEISLIEEDDSQYNSVSAEGKRY